MELVGVRRTGSPSPAWGKQAGGTGRGQADGFTPTCVGKASSRVRHGSPPPAWGKLLAWGCHGFDDRFTPTRVGKATSSRGAFACPANGFTPTRAGESDFPGVILQPVPVVPVHPHPRGESTAAKCFIVTGSTGSPPPAWGKQWLPQSLAAYDSSRFTPTRVGKAR